jgi:hypothetical protein
MMIKIWRYKAKEKSSVSGGAKQTLAFSTSLAAGRYVLGLDSADGYNAVFEQVQPIGQYVAGADAPPERVAGRYAYNLHAQDVEDQLNELAVSTGNAGLECFWHIVVSHHPDESISDEQAKIIRETVSKILGVEMCPMLWVTHHDRDHEHDHGLVVSYLAETNEKVSFGEGWWKEKAQIAIAICERDLGLKPEPNRRYVADHTGVYHLLTDTRIADADGNLVVDRKAMREMQRNHDEIIAANKAPEPFQPGDEWSRERALKMLVEPRIMDAGSWGEVHASLARVGLCYLKVGNTGSIRPISSNNAWHQAIGHSIAPNAVYANAALGKLCKRIGTYTPPPAHQSPPQFVMPRYNLPPEINHEEKAVSRAEYAEFKALQNHLNTDYRETYRSLRETEKGREVNKMRAARKAKHAAEVTAVKAARDHLVSRATFAKPKKRAAPALPSDQIAAFIWGELHDDPQTQNAWNAAAQNVAQKFKAKRKGDETHYHYRGSLAFIERQRTIEIILANRTARIFAMALARAKFKLARIAARKKVREYLAKIAAELDLAVGPQALADFAKAHRDKIGKSQRNGIITKARAWSEGGAQRTRLRRQGIDDRHERRSWTNQRIIHNLADWQERNDSDIASDRGCAPNQPKNIPLAASLMLDRVDRNALQLVRSRFHHERLRFLDDPHLLNNFSGKPRYLLLPNIQDRLAAIEAIQMAERQWIAAALLKGRISIDDGELKITKAEDRWAVDFWNGQKSDPSLHRLLMVARLRPDRFDVDLDERPDLRAWREARSKDPHNLAIGIADEIFLATDKEAQQQAAQARRQRTGAGPTAAKIADVYRESLFRKMPFEDAKALRKTKGRWAEAYRGILYREPNETNSQWQRRVKLAQATMRGNHRAY